MALTPGIRLGPYEILSALGAGGMGEVYRARDAKLQRDVAIKVLPESLANDPDRLARFQREAQVLASLNHPNIAAIHGLEEANGATALVMELVEGEDLSQRIARGAIPIEETLTIARQIAEAFEAAHEQGIIHRDLKPANIKVREDGTVKVLDFGLAKTMEPVRSAANVSQSPTMTTPAMTQAGIIFGTAGYMSPEQARGRTVDKRADVWAFGVVLFEMVTGRRAFEGDDIAITLAAVMMNEPDWRALPATTPVALRRLLTRCLKKDPRARMRDIGEARIQIEELLGGGPEEARIGPIARAQSPWQRAWPWASIGTLAMAMMLMLALWAPWRTAPDPARVTFDVQSATTGGASSFMLALSPDGTHVVTPSLVGDVLRLWVRPLARLEGLTLARTDAAAHPFWSPDGGSSGFSRTAS